MKSRERTWYNGSEKNKGHERSSLHGQNNTGSAPPSTNDEVFTEAWGYRNSHAIQNQPEDGNQVAQKMGWNGGQPERPKPEAAPKPAEA